MTSDTPTNGEIEQAARRFMEAARGTANDAPRVTEAQFERAVAEQVEIAQSTLSAVRKSS